jgi:SWI/SNF-related matrix-associated actin-dependent regulator 1 of chromatin subfamily A
MNTANKAKATGPVRKAKLVKGVVEIRFDYSSEMVVLVKTFEDRRWHSEDKMWSAPPSLSVVDALKRNGFTLCPELTTWAKAHEPAPVEKTHKAIPGLKCTLRPFQAEGVARIDGFHGRALLADDCGLGKTAQGIAWLQLHKDARPAVILCPCAVKEMWAAKIAEWMTDETSIILSGKPGKTAAFTTQHTGKKNPAGPIYILNYDILGNKIETTVREDGVKKRKEVENTGWVDWLLAKNPMVTIADEAHYVRNPKCGRGLGGAKLMKATPNAICLTGTPIVNRPAEFFPILNTLVPHQFRNFFKFGKRYCGARHNGFGWEFKGASNQAELHDILTKTVMIRRLKSEVLKELPAKVRAVVPLAVEAKYMREYLREERELAELEADDKLLAISKIIALKQAAVRAKLDAACRWIEDFLESGEKLVVFVHHHFVADAIRERFSKITKVAEVTGTTKGSRQAQQDMFQSDPDCRLFLGSKAAKEGLTLTAASNTAFLELWDTPGDMAQAEDRVHRIGQEDSVTSWYLVAAGTIEEDNAALLDSKLQVLAQVVDGREAQDEELITALLAAVVKRNEGRS